MTQESNLRRDVEPSLASEIVTCEANEAQRVIPGKQRWLALSGMVSLLVAAVAAVGYDVDQALVWAVVAVGIGFFVAEWIVSIRERRRFFAAVQELYPDADPGDFAHLHLFPAHRGVDGKNKDVDYGFVRIAGADLYWQGVWFRMRVNRVDIRKASGENDGYSDGVTLEKQPRAVFAAIDSFTLYHRPGSKRRAFATRDQQVLAWYHDGRTKEESP